MVGQCSRMSHEAVPSEPSQQHKCFQNPVSLKLKQKKKKGGVGAGGRYNLNL